MAVPQRLSYITLGARSMSALRAFYVGLGWRERPGSSDDFATYDAGAAIVALFPIDRLGAEAAPDEARPGTAWSGVTFGINVDDRDEVDRAFDAALSAGAKAIAKPVQREWGGYSGYIADPEGNRWEITWAPGQSTLTSSDR